MYDSVFDSDSIPDSNDSQHESGTLLLMWFRICRLIESFTSIFESKNIKCESQTHDGNDLNQESNQESRIYDSKNLWSEEEIGTKKTKKKKRLTNLNKLKH